MKYRMRLSYGLLPIIAITLFLEVAKAQSRITPSGTTVVKATSPKGTAVVTIATATIQDGCANSCPASRAWIELGAQNVAVVRKIDISIDGHPVAVPLSVYASLFQPKDSSLRFVKGSFVLRITGADGGESYFLLLYFDSSGISQLKLYNSEFPSQPAQVTRFYHNAY